MIKFLTGEALIKEIDSIIWDAQENLMIVSPFIRLDEHFKKLFSHHQENEKLQITIVFGKNEGDVSKSLNKDDFDFLIKFPNISIIYEPTLHAKFYGNNTKGVVTSINLHDHSFRNNIEFGISANSSITDRLLPTSSADMKAWEECWNIAMNGTVVFIRRPKIQKKALGLIKSYVGSETLYDCTDEFYGRKGSNPTLARKMLSDFDDTIQYGKINESMPQREMPHRERTENVSQKEKPSLKKEDWSHVTKGYCIRTREEIPFDPTRPFSYNAYKEWDQYGNWEYPEKFCHLTGERSNKQTSRLKPILTSEYRNKEEKKISQSIR